MSGGDVADSLPDVSRFQRVVFFTGAGLSAESGLATYRGEGGVWQSYDWRRVACQRAFLEDPDRVWDWHDGRRAKALAAAPSHGHRIIAEVQLRVPGTKIVTQNVDGLHQGAGASDVIELHGSTWRVRCDAEGRVFENREVPIASRRCSCGAWLRPDIVWFEDPMPRAPLEAAARAIEACDLLVSVGTSGVVHPAARLPQRALRRGATLIEINLEDTPVSSWYPIRLRGRASDALARLWPDLATS